MVDMETTKTTLGVVMEVLVRRVPKCVWYSTSTVRYYRRVIGINIYIYGCWLTRVFWWLPSAESGRGVCVRVLLCVVAARFTAARDFIALSVHTHARKEKKHARCVHVVSTSGGKKYAKERSSVFRRRLID